MKKIILITGMPGSGKSTAAKIFSDIKVPVVGMGDAVREQMRERGIEINDINLRSFSAEMRAKFGPDYVINLVSSKLDGVLASNDIAVLDGVRNVAEIDFLKKAGHETRSIAILTDKEVRYSRMLDRHNESDSDSFSGFELRDQKELKFGISEVISLADRYILNNSSFDSFKSSLLEVYQQELENTQTKNT